MSRVSQSKVAAPKVATQKKASTKAADNEQPRLKEALKRGALKKTKREKIAPIPNGLTFPDPGFHIAVLGALLDRKVFSVGQIQSSFEGLEFDEEASETERLLAAMPRLQAIRMDPKEVARIETLDFDGGNEIYMVLEDAADAETGGEDDTYSLLAITGIEALSGLKTLDLDGHGYRAETLDLKPLKAHPSLQKLTLTGKCKPFTVLDSLPKLVHLDLRFADPIAPTVIARLAKRGVEIISRS